jgi:hypothetical protein
MTMTSQSETARVVADAARPASVPTSPVKLPGHVCPIVGALNGRSGRLDRPGENGEPRDVPVAFEMEDVVGFQLASLAVSLQYRQLSYVQRGYT